MYTQKSSLKWLLAFFAAAAVGVSAQAADYSLTVSGGVVGHLVYPTMFGTNVVYNKVTVSQWPAFLSAFDALGMTTMRYPGGGAAENGFDFRSSSGPTNSYISLTMFLQAVAARSATPLLVVPTEQFVNNYQTTGAQYAKDFVQAVNIDHGVAGGEQFGTTQTVQLWELGNEYYDANSGLTPDSYGQIADTFASAMKTIDSTITPMVQFQVGHDTDTQTVKNHLTSGAVGACLTHTYPGGTSAIDQLSTQIVNGATIYGVDAAVTEWNMAGNSVDAGLVVANFLPKIFRQLVTAGVTISTQWPLMWSTDGVPYALANSDGTLRPAGQVFQWLSQAAQNRHIVTTSSSDPSIDCVAFKDTTAGKLSILVLCGASKNTAQVAITVNGFGPSTNWSVSSATRYSAAGGYGTEASNAPQAVLRTVAPVKNSNVLTITTNKFSQQEVIRIDLTQ